MTATTPTPHRWRFFQAGGFDQVRLDTGADLAALGSLDQKLWVALSCPVAGLEFDEATLALIDTDHDGHIRAPELIAAIDWACARLFSPDTLIGGQPLPLSAIDDRHEDGQRLLAAARQLLAHLGRQAADTLCVADTTEALEQVFKEARQAWESAPQSDPALLPLGAETESAHASFLAVRGKIDDFFTRCRLAAFDPRAAALLNSGEEHLKTLGAQALTPATAALADLPLAYVSAAAELPLREALNPAWQTAIRQFADTVVAPLIGARETLSLEDWQAVQERFAPYEAWMARRPENRPDALLSGDMATALADLNRLTRYVRDLDKLANNFVAFRDFYTGRDQAVFQAGTLYLDGRSATLCLKVLDSARHARLAGLSGVFLAYCKCVRGDETLQIAAAFTAGDADQLMVGRNGVFYDRAGRDWDATITEIVEHPISIRQAFWSPYKKLARLIANQAQKFAAARAQASDQLLAGHASEIGQKIESGKPAAPSAFDVGKFAGIFAAMGLAIGAIGTAVVALVTSFLGLSLWQMPLAIAGLMLVISGPAMALAFFKLRNRNLGPILDANGWAINTRARINLPFGTALTQTPRLPEGAERALTDPYAEKKSRWPLLLGFGLLLILSLTYLIRSAA